jgi:transcriptional regulator with XRE-family HTH domain
VHIVHAPTTPSFGQVLRIARAAQGLSQRKLAQRAGIGPDRYWQLEKGYARPRVTELAQLAVALGVNIAERDATAGEPRA